MRSAGRPYAPRARSDPAAAAARSAANVFTRSLLALFGVVPWRAVPVMPVEIMLLPKWFPFHLDKISYWSRTVIVPLLVLMAKKPRARNPQGRHDRRTLPRAAAELGPTLKAPQQKASWFWFFRAVDNILRAAEPLFPKRTRQHAIDRARGLGRRAAQRRRRPRRDLSGDGQQRDDVRRARAPGRSSAAGHRAKIGRETPRRARRRDLLPALRLADLGHRPCLPRAAGSRRRERGGAGQARPRLARADAGARRARRLERAPARSAAGRLGFPIRQSALSRC